MVVTAAGTESDAEQILAMERAALDRWSKGDPDGFLEITDRDVVYFDPLRKLNGLAALAALYDEARGKISVDRYEMIDPSVEVSGDMAVLTFNYLAHVPDGVTRWNTTEVYRRSGGQWRIIHTHWSLTRLETS